ncbi:MAG: DJ-1/PfpI family protein, partial [Chloroflexota bacterium]|nr:DJ-1/PfpI family protein [Chloroflexota bacterium]
MAATKTLTLQGKRIAFLATNGVEQVELTKPWEAVTAAGAEVHLVSLEGGTIQGVNGMDTGDTFPVD